MIPVELVPILTSIGRWDLPIPGQPKPKPAPAPYQAPIKCEHTPWRQDDGSWWCPKCNKDPFKDELPLNDPDMYPDLREEE